MQVENALFCSFTFIIVKKKPLNTAVNTSRFKGMISIHLSLLIKAKQSMQKSTEFNYHEHLVYDTQLRSSYITERVMVIIH